MTLPDSLDVAVRLSAIALELGGQANPGEVATRVTQLAAKLVDCAAADIIRVGPAGDLRIVAASDPGLSELTRVAWDRWPHALEACPAVGSAATWTIQHGRYLHQLSSTTGVGEELVIALHVGRGEHGHLRFLFTEPIPAASTCRQLSAAFAIHAAAAMDQAALVDQLQNLRTALDSNREIGAAVGILMGRHVITYAQGFARLMGASQNENRKLKDVAAEVLYTGQLAHRSGAAR